jgi:hypothetical protein
MGLGVVLVHDVGFGVETVVFRPVKRNSYVLRVVEGGWRCVVVQDTSSGVRVVVVVVCIVGVDVGTDARFIGQVIGGWYVAGVGGCFTMVLVAIAGWSVVFVVVLVVCFL